MKTLRQGENAALPGGRTKLSVSWTPEKPGGLDADPSAFLLRADGKTRGDADMIFYNQPKSADGSVSIENGTFVADLDSVPTDIDRIAVALTIHGAEGTATSFKDLSVRIELDELLYKPATVAMTETALILCELYRKAGGWKIKAIGQGFAGGLDPLARSFGMDVAAEPTKEEAREAKLVSLAKKDPELVSLVKKVQISLEKKKPSVDKAKVALVLDISASMSQLFRSGKIDSFVRRIMALGYRLDDDQSIDAFLFGMEAHSYGRLDVDSYRDFVSSALREWPLEGGTYYGKVMRMVRDHYASQPDARSVPVFVMFVTDGGTGDPRLSETMIKEASDEPLFWKFMAIGPKPKGGAKGLSKRLPSGFDFLAYLDDMPGRRVDNADFFSVEDPTEPTDEELFDLLLEEYPRWLNEVQTAGILKP